jgi:two-component system phosphate regulon sensor histidine kinase PhoR
MVLWRLTVIYTLLIGCVLLTVGLLLIHHLYVHGANFNPWLVWCALLLCIITSILPALHLTRRFIRPLRKLTHGALRIAHGDYGYRVMLDVGDEGGALVHTFNALSEQLAAQFRQLREDREQLRAILSGMVEGVIAIDAQQRVLFVNARAAKLLDFPQQSAVGRNLWELIQQEPLQKIVQQGLVASEPYREELDWKGPIEKHLAVYVARLTGSPSTGQTDSPSTGQTGSPATGAILVINDTSELRRLERLRQEFVANVSHELKTPLSIIMADTETLLDGAIDDHEHRMLFLEHIAEQADRLHHLILDLLSLAQIESGADTLEFTRVSVSQAVQECMERHRSRAESKRLKLNVQHAGNAADAHLWADADAVEQILDNLVDNAVKYTPSGGQITVRWEVAGDMVRLVVEDTGIGIPERDLPRIFERFYRVDKARSRELGGTGLGLAIVKHLVQSMRGSVRAESEFGRGTRFIVQLPRAIALQEA